MRIKNLDLIIVMVFVVVNVVWINIPNHPLPPGILFALPLTFFLPGYSIMQVLFRRTAPEQTQGQNRFFRQPDQALERPVTSVDKILLGLGLSMAIDVLVGFSLNFLPVGINGQSWVISLSAITGVFTLLAFFLRSRDVPVAPDETPHVRVTVQDGILFATATLVAALAILLSIFRPLSPEPSFTQFWMLQNNQGSKECTVSLGVQSYETAAESYHIIMTINKSQTTALSSIMLQPQQKWTQVVPITPGTSRDLFVEAQLFRDDQPGTQYRSVHLTFRVSNIQNNGQTQQQCTLDAPA